MKTHTENEKLKNNSKRIIFIAIFFIISTTVFSQSRYLENGISGSCFTFNTTFASGGLNSFGASAAYSIGGIMDIGFQLKKEEGVVEGFSSTDWGFDFVYNIIVIKQTDFVPVSLQLEGSYGYVNRLPENWTNSEDSLDGQGFNLGVSVFREFNKKGIISFLIGAKGNYRNFIYTTTISGASAAERKEDLFWGGIAAVSLRPVNWPIFTVELEVVYNQLAGGIYLEPSFLIISPSF